MKTIKSAQPVPVIAKPFVFIGSSRESMPYAKALAGVLRHRYTPVGWYADAGVPHTFELFVESLSRYARECAAAVFIADADDVLKKRGEMLHVCRDNVLFELGLFIGSLGAGRVLVAAPGGSRLKWPTDLHGMHVTEFNVPARQGGASADLVKAALGTELDRIAQLLDSMMPSAAPPPDENVDPCFVDQHLSFQRSELHRQAPADGGRKRPESTDVSDLFFLLLSPPHCDTAYLQIASFVEEHRQAHDCQLLAAYDLMGNWDLMIRLTVRRDPDTFFRLLRQALVGTGVVAESDSSPFSRWRLVDVQQRGHSFKALAATAGAQPIRQLFLGSTDDYNRTRASRAFILIDTTSPGTESPNWGAGGRLKEFAQTLAGAIAHTPGGLSRIDSIVEAVSVGKNEMLIETMSTCAQSALINEMNRALGRQLGELKLQKYTLSCYVYREDRIRSLKGALTS